MLLLFGINKKNFSRELNKPIAPKEQIVEVKKQSSILEDLLNKPSEYSERFKFDSGEDETINLGKDITIYPYYAKLKYLLDPLDNYTPYYVISVGANYVDGEDIDLSVVNDLVERLNYGIGVGINLPNTEIEILYGRYNYQMLGNNLEKEKNEYSSTRLTLSFKYYFELFKN